MAYKSKGFLGDVNIGVFKLGDSDVKLYLGDMKVYPLGPIFNITYDAATYNGMPQIAQNIVVTDESGNTLVENVDYVVTENNGGTNAGSYPIVITLMGQYQGTDSTDFVINKVTPTVVSPTAKQLTYDASAQELVNAGSTDYGTLKYSIDGTSYSTSTPSGTTAGTYTVYYKVEGDSNVNDVAASTISCSIAKANSSLSFAVTDLTVAPGETKTNVVTVNAGDGTVTYISSDPSIVTVDNNGNVSGVSNGDTTVSANISSTNNYNSATTNYNVTCGLIVISKFNVTDTTNPTSIASVTTGFSKIEIDGVVQPSVTTGYTFDTTGEHTVKYYLSSTKIDSNSFLGCSAMISCVIGNGVTSIGGGAFQGCSGLTSVTMPYDITRIGAQTFRDCKNLKRINSNVDGVINIPSGVTSVEPWVFYCCSSITSVNMSNDVTIINSMSFYECKNLKRLNSNIDGAFNIPSSVTSIDQGAFTYCTGLTSIDIPDSVTSIGNYAFQGCSGLTSIDIPSGVTSINERTFASCNSLTSVTIGSGVTSIMEAAFSACPFTSIVIPDSVTTIGRDSFASCNRLTSIVIPSGVTSIGQSAFQYCISLTSVTINAIVPPSLTYSPFSGNYPIYVPCDSVDAYKAATNWSTYASRIQAIPGSCPPMVTAKLNVTNTSSPTRIAYRTNSFSNIEIDGVEQQSVVSAYTFSTTGEHTVKYYLRGTTIGASALSSCKSLTSINISDSVTSIGSKAFEYCSGITSVTIGNGVTSIGESAFTNCTSLTSMVIPDTVTSIGSHTFEDCSGLTSIEIPSSVTSINDAVFAGCTGLTSIDIPDSVTSIGNNAFYKCRSLTNINIPNGVTNIGGQTFLGCVGLTSINIPDSVTSIGNSAFYDCVGLTTCTIGSGVTSISDIAFFGCGSLITITSNAMTAPTIQNQTFRGVKANGTLYVSVGSSGYDTWMQNANYYLGLYNWTKVEV